MRNRCAIAGCIQSAISWVFLYGAPVLRETKLSGAMSDTDLLRVERCSSDVVNANGRDSTLDFAHGVDRLLLRLVICARKHFSEQPDRDQLKSAHNEEDRHKHQGAVFLHHLDVRDEFFK